MHSPQNQIKIIVEDKIIRIVWAGLRTAVLTCVAMARTLEQ